MRGVLWSVTLDIVYYREGASGTRSRELWCTLWLLSRAPSAHWIRKPAPASSKGNCGTSLCVGSRISPSSAVIPAGLPKGSTSRPPPPRPDNRAFAMGLWHAATNPRGTLVEQYLKSRRLDLPDEAAGEAIRFHASCSFGFPAMVCLCGTGPRSSAMARH
jgi:hypothetical protein